MRLQVFVENIKERIFVKNILWLLIVLALAALMTACGTEKSNDSTPDEKLTPIEDVLTPSSAPTPTETPTPEPIDENYGRFDVWRETKSIVWNAEDNTTQIVEYSYDDYGNLIEQAEYDTEGNKKSVVLNRYSYDSEKRLLKEEIWASWKNEYVLLKEFRYDDWGRICVTTYPSLVDVERAEREYEYSDSGLIERMYYCLTPGSEAEKKMKANGFDRLCVEERVYDMVHHSWTVYYCDMYTGEKQKHREKVYNKEGKIWKEYRNNENRIDEIEHIYDVAGNEIAKIDLQTGKEYQYPDGFTRECELDEEGRVHRYYWYEVDSEGHRKLSFSIEYSYDDAGNVISTTDYDADGKVTGRQSTAWKKFRIEMEAMNDLEWRSRWEDCVALGKDPNCE